MDRHDVPGASAEDVANAHVRDLEASKEAGVQFISYWFDADSGGVFCFANAPSRDALAEVHTVSHGLIPNEIIEVAKDDVFKFLGAVHDPQDASELSSPVRTVMFTDLVGSTAILEAVGETQFVEVLSTHDGIVREALYRSQGREVKHTGDGIMASFGDASSAIEAAIAICDGFAALPRDERIELRVRVGLATGRPVDRNDDIYGAAVVLASRLCDAADAQQILVADTVPAETREQFHLAGPRARTLKGFREPVQAYELVRGGAVPAKDSSEDAESPSWWKRVLRRSR